MVNVTEFVSSKDLGLCNPLSMLKIVGQHKRTMLAANGHRVIFVLWLHDVVCVINAWLPQQ
jgi:hypothetical protein